MTQNARIAAPWLILLAFGCIGTGQVSPAGSCLALGFGAWSAEGPSSLAPDRRQVLPLFRLSTDRAPWRKDEAWYQVRPLNYERIGPLGWETLSMWLRPTPDSLILFRVTERSWALYLAGTWQADTLRGRAYYWDRGLRVGESYSNVYAVRYDCSTFRGIGASDALLGLLRLDARRPDLSANEWVPERARRARVP